MFSDWNLALADSAQLEIKEQRVPTVSKSFTDNLLSFFYSSFINHFSALKCYSNLSLFIKQDYGLILQNKIIFNWILFILWRTWIFSNLKTERTFSKIYQNIDKGDDAGGIGDDERRKPFTSANKGIIASDEVDIDEKIHEENPYGDFYVNDETKPDFDVKNLGKIIEEKSKNEDDDFKKEYAVWINGLKKECFYSEWFPYI